MKKRSIREFICRAVVIFCVIALFLPSISSPQTTEEINKIIEQFMQLSREGKYREAIPVAEKILAIYERINGPEHRDVATALSNLAGLHYDLGDYRKAQPLYQRSLEIKEKVLGTDHPDTVNTMRALAETCRFTGEYAKAELLYKRVLAIKEKTLGPDHPETAAALNNLAELYRSVRDYVKAEPLYKRSLEIKEKTLGPDHPETATALNNLALLYDAVDEYTKAEAFFKRSLSIRERSLGPDHALTAQSLNNLAGLYMSIGEYAKAEPLYKRSLAIYEKTLGPDHPETATIAANLASFYKTIGDYAKAEPLYKRSLAIYENALGPDNYEVASILDDLAGLFLLSGEYQRSRTLYERALSIHKKVFGPDHLATTSSLSGLAKFFQEMGDYATSESLFKKVLAIHERSLGPMHRSTSASLNNLALLYVLMGDPSKAVPLYIRSVTITEKVLGPDHPSTAIAINNLANMYESIGDYATAESLYKRSLAIREKTLGPDHPDTANALNNLAVLYNTTGDYGKAEPLYKRSLTIHEKVLGSNHPNTANALNNLCVLYAATGRYGEAFDLRLRAQRIDSNLIDQVMGFTSEGQKMKFLATKEHTLYGFLTLAGLHKKDDRDALERALTVWLQRKGVVLEAQKRFQDALALSDDPKVAERFQELARMRAQLSRLIFSGPGKEGPDAYRKKLVELEAQKERLEAELSKMSDAFAKTKKVARADTRQVASSLPKGSALIDFVRLPIYNFTARKEQKRWGPPRYFAFVLPAGRPDGVSLIDLGDAGEIDRLIGELKRNIGNHQGDPEGKDSSRISRKLYNLVFAPVKKGLKDVKEIYISPDGSLNLIPFEILKGPDGRYLIEDHTFNYLGSGRDILGFGMVKAKSSHPLVIGDPDYDLDEAGQEASLKKLGMAPQKRSFAVRSGDMSAKGFPPLPGTKEEAEAIASLLGRKDALLYTGKDALEEVLMKHGSPRVLHLATHGFFLADQDLLDEKRKAPYENPLARSGIVLAGANRSIKTGSDEGLITAEKVLSLRLSGTELVVLSACETGLGDIKSGEGVFGLRRAFTQAGAKGLVMSMWSVPDRETKELMVNFYTNILVKKMKRSDALRQAILTELPEVKKRYGHTNPFFWGAFVYMGEP
ncbi:MAG TPA: tetratricopeptide repeat protein [Syntrophorhabdaceae bacterium]|nr:tetratricopeptide repeat protein [Syntrophorhabdaceae bacterium]